MTPDQVAALFTSRDGTYHFARWGRPVVPVVFGTDDATLAVVKAATEVVVSMSGHKMAEMDPEFGANLMLFFVRDWAELPRVKGLDALVPGLGALCTRLTAEDANQYRLFRFDQGGAIKAAFVFLRMDDALSQMAAEDLALLQAVRMICLWSDGSFAGASPLAQIAGRAVLRPEIAAVIRAAYARSLPAAAHDPSHALRLAARMTL